MIKQKVGLVIFWIGIVYFFGWLVIGWTITGPTFRNLTIEEVNQTIWAFPGPMAMLSATGIALGAIIAGIGALLYSGAKGSAVWKVGIGIFMALIISMTVGNFGHFPPLFGIGAILILLSFTGILWLWAKERMALAGSSPVAADFRLVGYICMLIAAWFTCGIASQPYWKMYEGQAPISPIHVMIFLVLGWIFLFLSHYKATQLKKTENK